jgi:hypothetical protein
MTHEEALKMIEETSLEQLKTLPLGNFYTLTNRFDKDAIRAIISKGTTLEEQKYAFGMLKAAYRSAELYWRNSHHMCDIEVCLNLGRMITAPCSDESIGASLKPAPAAPDSPQQKCSPANLEAELEELREQVEHFRNKEKGTALGLNQGQAALFGLALANTFHFNYTNKKKQLAPLLHKLFGWGQTKLKGCLSTPCDKAERDELANLFKDLCPPLYKTIMNWGELPQ